MSLESEMPSAGAPRYARFNRHLRAMVIDWMLALAFAFGAMFVAVSVRSEFSRGLGILVIIGLLLYEPLLVSLTGSTLGHYVANLRVVDERRRGNLSFGNALLRSVLKGLLGWYSFLVMTATRRNQAVHDLLTRSTVQLRDPARARPHHYITERTDLSVAGMPSRPRRVAIIAASLLLLCLVYAAVLAAGSAAGAFSVECSNHEPCRVLNSVFFFVSAVLWLAACSACIGLGWRGKLFGLRGSV